MVIMIEPAYQDIPDLSRSEVEAAVRDDDPEGLQVAVLAASLYHDPVWAANLCLRLSTHADAGVRGNAILGLGHLARRGAPLDREQVRRAVENASTDEDPFVRGQAEAAADDIAHFLS